MVVHALESTPPIAEHHDGSAVLRLWRPKPRLLVSLADGHLSVALAHAIIEQCESMGPAFSHYINWWNVASYDIASQRDLTLWSAKNLRRLVSVHLLTQSALVRMGVSAANVAISGLIKLSSEPLDYAAALDRALAASEARARGPGVP